MVKYASLVLALFAAPLALAAEEGANAAAAGAEKSAPVDWESWHAGNDVTDIASLQRGARNFMNYCVGCHSLKYVRYQRVADDLKIPASVLSAELVAPGSNALDYITTAMPAHDAENWFGTVPPDLSLIARSRGVNYIYRYLKTFYTDTSRPTLSNNLAFPTTAMPAVVSDLEGVKQAVFRDVKSGSGADATTEQVFDHFETTVPGNMSAEQFDGFVRDTVNFLDYAGEPVQVERRSYGLWVVLYLLMLTAFAWLLKKEYWKEVH